MTLAQFLEALKTESTIVLKNLADNELIAELKSSTFHSLDDAIEARTIAQWSVEGGSRIIILLNATETPETSETSGGGE